MFKKSIPFLLQGIGTPKKPNILRSLEDFGPLIVCKEPKERRSILCDVTGEAVEAGLFHRADLQPGDSFSGPALVVDNDWVRGGDNMQFAGDVEFYHTGILAPGGDYDIEVRTFQGAVAWDDINDRGGSGGGFDLLVPADTTSHYGGIPYEIYLVNMTGLIDMC